jgi:putative signal transducing protein
MRSQDVYATMQPVSYERRVTIATFSTPWEAQLARARLEAEGIDAWISDENLARLGFSNAIGGVRLQVREEEAKVAAELLQREARLPEIYLVTEEEARLPRCPECNSDRLNLERWSRLLLVGSLLLLRFPILVPRKRWRCRSCGGMWKEEELRGRPTVARAPLAAEEVEVEEMETARPAAPEALDPTALVTVGRFTTPWEAHLARTRLEFEGIDACVHEERLPMVNLISGQLLALNRLEVTPADAPRALAILAGRASSP